jgi:crotonobetainyl-CoA:carnitine CoA-transferase CaiB-like acyl-CoA transferase
MTARSIPFSEIKSVKQLFEEPEIQQMQLTERVESKKFAKEGKEYLEYPKNPLRYSKNELVDFKEPPLLGEDTDKILKAILGYTEDTIA